MEITYWYFHIAHSLKKEESENMLPTDNIPSLPTQIETPLTELAVRFSGKLLLRREIPLDEKHFQQLLNSGFFTSKPAMIRKKFNCQCQRCGNQKRSLLANIPCPSCGKTHFYCRKCIEMGRVMECEQLYYWTGPEAVWVRYENPCTWDGSLTAEQRKAAERVIIAANRRDRELLIWAVAGAGKTEMLFPGITDALQQGRRICIATPRADVVRELLPRIRKAFSDVSVQGLFSGSRDTDGTAQIIISTTHQLLRYQSAFDLVIIDEIDAFPFHGDTSLPYAANRAKKIDGTTVYLTATPRKNQRIQINRKKLPHVFVPIRFHRNPLPVPQFHMCFSLKKDLKKYSPPQAFMRWLKRRKNPRRQLLLFVPTIVLAENLRGKLAALLVKESMLTEANKLVSVHAQDPDRENKVQLFREKQISILITTTILERGVTFPSVDVVVFDAAHAVFDEAALVQISGRAGRSPDDPTGEVVFFHDGKTEAMIEAVDAIISMNNRGGFR